MQSGYYAALTGLLARSQTLDTVASNLANVGTSGFRAQSDFFSNVLAGPRVNDSQLDQAVNNYGVLGGTVVDLTQGAIKETGNPLDIAIQGEGFFAVKTPAGIRYTRDGRLVRAADGKLTTADGNYPVLNAKDKEISLPPGNPVIGSDGTISYDGAIAGGVAVFRFKSANDLKADGVNLYQSLSKTKPAISKDFTIRQGALEGSNQDVIQGTMQLVLAQRQAQMMEKAITIFYDDFNKPATEDLPKV